MTGRTSALLLGAVTILAAALIACGSAGAKSSQPPAYPAAIGYAYSPDPHAGHYHGLEAPAQPSISISGAGTASAPPDVAVVTVTVSAFAPTAAEVRDLGKQAIGDLLATLKSRGVASEDVETRSFTISPVTRVDEGTGEREVVEYRLSNVSQVTIRNVDEVGQVLDDVAGQAGESVRISNINLKIEDPTEIQRQARDEAMRDAQAKAQQLADLAGVRLGPPLSISESLDGAPSGLVSKEVLVAPLEEGVAPVAVGELEAAVSIYVVYSIAAE